MQDMTPRATDIDRRLRDRAGVGLIDWMRAQRASKSSLGLMSRRLFDLTGDFVSYETLRRWCEQNGIRKEAA